MPQYNFAITSDSNGKHVQTFTFAKSRFPFLFQGYTIDISGADLFGVPKADKSVSELSALTIHDDQLDRDVHVEAAKRVGQLEHCVTDGTDRWSAKLAKKADKIDWTFTDAQNIVDLLDDILIVFHYTMAKARSGS